MAGPPPYELGSPNRCRTPRFIRIPFFGLGTVLPMRKYPAVVLPHPVFFLIIQFVVIYDEFRADFFRSQLE